LVEAFLTNERINQVLLDSLSPDVWRAQPPCSKRRNIATTFAHMHNVRCMRLKMSARDEEQPAKLDRAEVTLAEAKDALGQSARAMVRLIERSLAAGGHVPDCRPDRLHRMPSAAHAQAAKRAFRILALRLHPDQGGRHEDFIRLKDTYDRAEAGWRRKAG
jgi:hypothetical protein